MTLRRKICLILLKTKEKERLDNKEDTKNNISLEVDNPQTSNTLMSCQEKEVIHSYSRKTKL